jgi:exopolyphosphatase/pppGpp-phosphohydrolase
MYAAIDAGSNTLRLLIGTIEQGRVIPLKYQRHICRLAGKFSQKEGLAPDAMERRRSMVHNSQQMFRKKRACP